MTNQRRRRTARGSYDAADVKRRIIPARDSTPINSLLVYARNGVGKTRLCGSCARIARTLIIDCEEGTASVVGTDAEVYKLTSFSQIDEVYWYLSTQDHGFKFVCIDPITRLGQHAMTQVLGEKAAADLAADPYTPTQQDWGKTGELMRNAIMRYKQLAIEQGWFLIVTAYERRRNNDDEEGAYDFIIGPDAQPAVKGFLMGQMDIIGRLYIKALDSEEGTDDEEQLTVERRLLVGPHEIYESKDRSDRLPRVLRRPTMQRVMALVNQRREG